MTTYKERQQNLQMFVLQKGCVVLGTFGNLKKVCAYLDGKDFYKYNTIVRKKDEDYPITKGDYTVFKVKHT